jgi:uncharacterized protein YukE
MTDPLQVTPSRLRSVADDLADLSSRMDQVLSALKAQLEAPGPVWGDDLTGHQFADGATGYKAQAGGVANEFGEKKAVRDGYSAGLNASTRTFEGQGQP